MSLPPQTVVLRILHLLGLDHERLTFNSAARDFCPTEVGGNVEHALFG